MTDDATAGPFARVRRRLGLRGAAAPGDDVALVAASGLFDHEWYSRCLGRRVSRREAVEHYLATGRDQGLTPHPLLDPETLFRARPRRIGDRDPLVAYLTERMYRIPTHPLFDVGAYVAAYPESLDHRDGPIGHYVEIGAREGLAPNDWYQPTAGHPNGLFDWIEEARQDWAARRDQDVPEAEVPWAELAERRLDPALVSVVMTADEDAVATARAVAAARRDADRSGASVEVVVVDGTHGQVPGTALVALPLRFPSVTVVPAPKGVDLVATPRNAGLAAARGATVVFLDDRTEVSPGWLPPLVAALSDDKVLAAQSLILFDTGAVESAGFAFAGGVPHHLLAGFPVEDGCGLESQSFHALSGDALAVRHRDVVALRGFDPVIGPGLVDADFGLRLGRLRPGRLVVRPDSVVVHHVPRAANPAPDDTAFLDRWAGDLPSDDVELWAGRGFVVSDHREHGTPVMDRRTERVSVDERAPSLRWAIKNAAPPGEAGERWGDTHFARQVAAALRGLGQEVVVDHRPEFHRESRNVDDVALLLRGRAAYQPAPGQVNLMWLISHPELVDREEAAGYDRVLAASASWSERTSAEWGLRVDPLLQATDPASFHPDLAAPDSGDRVLFVGGSRKQLRPLVRDAIEAGLPLAVYGNGWEPLIPASYIRSAYLANDRIGAAYRAAGVVLNDHWDDMRDEGFLSNRLFDAVAAGARVITDDVAGLRDVFGQTVQVARNAEELAALARAEDLDAVFGNDEVRREWATRIHAEHSFAARARTLLETVLEIRAAKQTQT